jgi:glyoxylase-like metal-dependent hydrolase (beta-lactamase superfamily II)
MDETAIGTRTITCWLSFDPNGGAHAVSETSKLAGYEWNLHRGSDAKCWGVRPADIGRAVRASALSLFLAVTAFGQALCQPAQVDPAASNFQLGDLKLAALRDAQNIVVNDGKIFGANVGSAAVASILTASGAPTDKVTLDVNALLVRGGHRIMLFDTGLGPAVHGALMGSLALAGVSPADVTDIFITHSHFDHVGGLTTSDGQLAFTGAVIHMSAKEWAWMKSDPDNKILVTLIAPRVRPFKPGAVIVPGVTAVALYGHTPGHVGYEIESGGKRLLDMGDTAHSAIVSLGKPDWAIGYDNDSKLGEANRRVTLTRLSASQEPVFAPHFPFPGIGKIQTAGDGFSWKPGLP